MSTLRFCKFCGTPFIAELYHQNRNHCYEEVCVYEFDREQLKKTRERSLQHGENQKAERRKPKKKNELCTCCHLRPKMKGNHFLCEICYKEASSIFEVDYGFGIDKHFLGKV